MNEIERFKELVENSDNIVFFGGAGVETRNRKKFCARIATGDYDAVIIGHSQFERIPISPEQQERDVYKRQALITVLPEQLQSPQLTAEWENRLKAVSYTHLDVYKRQFLM